MLKIYYLLLEIQEHLKKKTIVGMNWLPTVKKKLIFTDQKKDIVKFNLLTISIINFGRYEWVFQIIDYSWIMIIEISYWI